MKTKRLLCAMLGFLLAIPAVLLAWGFALPAQYGDTFLGELAAKRALLAADTGQKPRLVLVGGSAVAFGVDSALLEQQLPQYDAVNFGLYAALGTRVMLDLSVDLLRAGDVVLVMPEQQRQALSDYLGAEALWQAADTDHSLLAALHARDLAPMLGRFPRFAGSKFRCWLQGAPTGTGIYRKASFDAAGDLCGALYPANILPGGYDPTTPILFDDDLPEQAFCAALNAYTDTLAARGVAVYYHFPPMNAAAVDAAADPDAYADALRSRLRAELCGSPWDCILESGWFYDTNFHLNAAGKTVFTRQLIRDVKAVLGDATPTEIALPALPAPTAAAPLAALDSADSACFTWAARTDGGDGVCLKGVTGQGAACAALTIPAMVDGQAVTQLAPGMFDGCAALRRVTVQQNITALPDGLFAGCPALQEIALCESDPARLAVGAALLDGAQADCTLLVPAAAYTDYCLSYAWSPYAARLTPWERG